jgi:hypothetical protein
MDAFFSLYTGGRSPSHTDQQEDGG